MNKLFLSLSALSLSALLFVGCTGACQQQSPCTNGLIKSYITERGRNVYPMINNCMYDNPYTCLTKEENTIGIMKFCASLTSANANSNAGIIGSSMAVGIGNSNPEIYNDCISNLENG